MVNAATTKAAAPAKAAPAKVRLLKRANLGPFPSGTQETRSGLCGGSLGFILSEARPLTRCARVCVVHARWIDQAAPAKAAPAKPAAAPKAKRMAPDASGTACVAGHGMDWTGEAQSDR